MKYLIIGVNFELDILLVSHEADLDGIFSSSIGLIRYPQARTLYIGYGRENFIKMSNVIKDFTRLSRDGKVIVTDLGLNDDFVELCKETFSYAREFGWQITWIDHHPWSEKAINAVNPLIEIVLDNTNTKCAADLVYSKLLPDNAMAATLASLAHSMDFFLKDQHLTPIAELIKYYQTFSNYYYRLYRLAKKAANGVLWDTDMQKDYNNYVGLRDSAKIQAFNTMKLKTIKDFKVAFLESSPFLQSSLFSEDVFTRTKADLVIFYGPDGRISIRRNNNSISCSEIASNLPEGGGHSFAAGARVSSNPADIVAMINELEIAILKTVNKSNLNANVSNNDL